MARVGVIGAGYVGLVTGVCLAALGHEVTLRDIDPRKVDALNAGDVPIYEPGLAELIAEHRARLTFTLDLPTLLERGDLIFIAVDTPPTYSGDADLSRVMGFVAELAKVGAESRHLLIMKSTVPVGTGERVRAELDAHGLDVVGYCSNPEFLKEGAAIDDFMHPDRVVIGSSTDADGDRVAALYEPLGAPIVRTSVPTAEMIKYASNAFLATKISFINEIANVCEEVGADVVTVADGMGFDRRIGRAFLNAGIGFGGSCLDGAETVLVRTGAGAPSIERLDALLERLAPELDTSEGAVVEVDDLEVLAWRTGSDAPSFERVSLATRRWFDGDVIEVRTKMGRRVTVTDDHPMIVQHPERCGGIGVKVAGNLRDLDWIPVAQGFGSLPDDVATARPADAIATCGLARDQVIVRAGAERLAALGRGAVRDAVATLRPAGAVAWRTHDMLRSGTLRLPELDALGEPLSDRTLIGTARNGTFVPAEFPMDRRFWRVVGLYLAEGHLAVDGARRRICWSFHPTDEMDLVDEVAGYWESLGVTATVRRSTTTCDVSVSSRLLATWWTDVFGLGANAYGQRVPDAIWTRSADDKHALLAGAWRGDGSCSRINGGPSLVLEYGTVSRELADGLLRLLGDIEITARLKVGRTAKSTVDTYWLVISGADQIERLTEFVRPSRRGELESSVRATKRIAPTGYRRREPGCAWVRVVATERRRFAGPVYSLEVPTASTFVTTGGTIVHNCFPKDVSALKQLAGNSGYHFQLLTAVIEVNELQKRRVIGKLKRHLGDLGGRTVTLLGVAFKPETDDIREAASLVLASRLLAEGAIVRVYDPVALDVARDHLRGVEFHEDPVQALAGADAAVVVTEWRQIIDLDWPAAITGMAGSPIVIDGRNALDAAIVRGAGATYDAVGRA